MKILRRLLTVLAALVLFGVVCAAGLIGFVYYKETHLPPVGDFDTIIVLGAQVKADGTPSVALERRLTAALEEYQKQPMLMIVCGAQGSDEPRAEGDVMRDWLIEHFMLGEAGKPLLHESLFHPRAMARVDCLFAHAFLLFGALPQTPPET